MSSLLSYLVAGSVLVIAAEKMDVLLNPPESLLSHESLSLYYMDVL